MSTPKKCWQQSGLTALFSPALCNMPGRTYRCEWVRCTEQVLEVSTAEEIGHRFPAEVYQNRPGQNTDKYPFPRTFTSIFQLPYTMERPDHLIYLRGRPVRIPGKKNLIARLRKLRQINRLPKKNRPGNRETYT